MTGHLEACGWKCSDCKHYFGECKGCTPIAGKVFWAAFVDESGICPIYNCAVNQKKYTNCGACSELPCRLFYDLQDPEQSPREHRRLIDLRVQRLRAQQGADCSSASD